MRRLIIADIKSPQLNGVSTGHFFAVARNYYEMFHDVIKTMVSGGPVYQNQFKDVLLQLPNDILNTKDSIWKSKLKYFQNSIELFKETEGDIVVIQQGGVLTSFVAMSLFYKKNSRMFLIQYSKEGVNHPLKRLLYKIVRNKIDGIICPNDDVGKAYERPYCVVPDYIYTGNYLCPRKTYEEKNYDVCFVGRIEEEKGILEVARKIAGTNYKMIIAGKVSFKWIANELKNICDGCANIELKIGYVPDEEYYSYIHNSRFCILNYQGEYSRRSSGVVLDIIFNDVPIIGKRCQALRFIEENRIGYIYDNLEDLDLSHILTKDYYYSCIREIAIYKRKHEEYKKKLADFIGIAQ